MTPAEYAQAAISMAPVFGVVALWLLWGLVFRKRK